MAELGLESKFLEETDKTGIHELPSDAPVGEDAIKYMQMDEKEKVYSDILDWLNAI